MFIEVDYQKVCSCAGVKRKIISKYGSRGLWTFQFANKYITDKAHKLLKKYMLVTMSL